MDSAPPAVSRVAAWSDLRDIPRMWPASFVAQQPAGPRTEVVVLLPPAPEDQERGHTRSLSGSPPRTPPGPVTDSTPKSPPAAAPVLLSTLPPVVPLTAESTLPSADPAALPSTNAPTPRPVDLDAHVEGRPFGPAPLLRAGTGQPFLDAYKLPRDPPSRQTGRLQPQGEEPLGDHRNIEDRFARELEPIPNPAPPVIQGPLQPLSLDVRRGLAPRIPP